MAVFYTIARQLEVPGSKFVMNESPGGATLLFSFTTILIKQLMLILIMLGIFFDADGTLWSHPKSEQRYSDKFLTKLFNYLNSENIGYFVISGTTEEIFSKRLNEHNINCIENCRIIALADGGVGKGNKIQEVVSKNKFDKIIWVFDKIKDYHHLEKIRNVKYIMVKREHNTEDVSKAKEIKNITIVSSLNEVLNIIKN